MSESCDVNKPSDNLIVYGHHMKNGTMFSDLEKFKSKEFWEEHKTFRFDTLYVKQTYEIIAVFKTAVYTGSENEFRYFQFVDAATDQLRRGLRDWTHDLPTLRTPIEFHTPPPSLSGCQRRTVYRLPRQPVSRN